MQCVLYVLNGQQSEMVFWFNPSPIVQLERRKQKCLLAYSYLFTRIFLFFRRIRESAKRKQRIWQIQCCLRCTKSSQQTRKESMRTQRRHQEAQNCVYPEILITQILIFYILSIYTTWDGLSLKTNSRYYPFNDIHNTDVCVYD